LEALARKHPNVTLRIVDIGSWHSDVAGQYGIRRLPTVWLYEDGVLWSKDRDRVFGRLASLQ